MNELLRVVGKMLLAKGEEWRCGEGAELLDAYEAALAQREPVSEGEVAQVCVALRKGQALRGGGAQMASYIADLLERTEAERLAAEARRQSIEQSANGICQQKDDLATQLTAERARSEKLVELVVNKIHEWRLEGANVNTEWHGGLVTAANELDAALAAYQSSKENDNG